MCQPESRTRALVSIVAQPDAWSHSACSAIAPRIVNTSRRVTWKRPPRELAKSAPPISAVQVMWPNGARTARSVSFSMIAKIVCWLRLSIIVLSAYPGALEGREAGADHGPRGPSRRAARGGGTWWATSSSTAPLPISSITPTAMNVPFRARQQVGLQQRGPDQPPPCPRVGSRTRPPRSSGSRRGGRERERGHRHRDHEAADDDDRRDQDRVVGELGDDRGHEPREESAGQQQLPEPRRKVDEVPLGFADAGLSMSSAMAAATVGAARGRPPPPDPEYPAAS